MRAGDPIGDRRPTAREPFHPTRAAVLGAGMMGASIAYLAAAAGVDVVLCDTSLAAANRGKAQAEVAARRAIERGVLDRADAKRLLARIAPADSLRAAGGAQLVIEAVYEDVDLKAAVLAEIDHVAAADALIASNTSTLPITQLAASVSRPGDFVGLHFFSPAERMPLLEIVAGRQTSSGTLARSLDVAALLGKTPIVVADGRGFFTSRVIATYIDEGLTMLLEGIPAASVERAALAAGYPIGVLALIDELSLELIRTIRRQYRSAAAAEGVAVAGAASDALIDTMIDAHRRPGRSAGAGFYDYADGRRAGLWPGLEDRARTSVPAARLRDLQERLLFIEALEAVRCRDEGVIESVADANVGSILGIGFPTWTGGVLQYINGYEGGPAGFVERAQRLASTAGERFAPPQSLVALAQRGGTYRDC